MSKVTGGPAFPSNFSKERGMTLRDHFAAVALQGCYLLFQKNTLIRVL